MEGTKGIPVLIHMATTIEDDGQRDESSMEAQGLLFLKGATTFVRFEEPVDEVGAGTTMQTMKIQEQEISVTRKGAITMNQRFISGMETEGMLHSPYGPMAMRTKTTEVSFCWNADKGFGELRLQYELELQEEHAGEYKMEVTLKEVLN